MAYSDFTLEQVVEQFSLELLPGTLFADVTALPPPTWLEESLKRGRSWPQETEKARSELIVVPILQAVQTSITGDCTIHSGQALNADPPRGLNGECDFILTRAPAVPIVQAPVVTIVEAKRGDIILGRGQCAAQMVGAQVFNERHGRAGQTVFGCITSGELWEFLRLQGSRLEIDPTHLHIGDLGLILAVFQRMLS